MEHGQLPFSAWPVVVLLPPVCLLFAACCSLVEVIGPVAHLQQHQAVLHFQPPNKSDKTPQHNLLNYKKIHSCSLVDQTQYHYILQKKKIISILQIQRWQTRSTWETKMHFTEEVLKEEWGVVCDTGQEWQRATNILTGFIPFSRNKFPRLLQAFSGLRFIF